MENKKIKLSNDGGNTISKIPVNHEAIKRIADGLIKRDFPTININIENDNENIKFDNESKTLTIDISKQKKYTVYLYEVGKQNEVYPEVMTETALKDLEHRIWSKATNKRIQSKELFIEE